MSHTDILGAFPSLPPDVQVRAKLAACLEHHIPYSEFLDLDRETRAQVYRRAEEAGGLTPRRRTP